MSAIATAEDLKALYERQLRYDIGNLGLGSEERRGFWQLLSASRHMQPGEFHEENHAQVWLWSDLHLGHAMTISVFGRPYKTPDEMDDALFGAWRRVVEPDDTIVILGDIAIGGLSGRRLKRFRAAPGRKILVVGNHEFDDTFGGHLDGFDEVFSSVYVPGSPELLLTHVPLRHVPEGCVNVHGHRHIGTPSGTRHINVVVEQVRYRPRSLTAGSPSRDVFGRGRARAGAHDGRATEPRRPCGRVTSDWGDRVNRRQRRAERSAPPPKGGLGAATATPHKHQPPQSDTSRPSNPGRPATPGRRHHIQYGLGVGRKDSEPAPGRGGIAAGGFGRD